MKGKRAEFAKGTNFIDCILKIYHSVIANTLLKKLNFFIANWPADFLKKAQNIYFTTTLALNRVTPSKAKIVHRVHER